MRAELNSDKIIQIRKNSSRSGDELNAQRDEYPKDGRQLRSACNVKYSISSAAAGYLAAD
jgi:hypothetical protein